ncbi:aspartate kinase [Lentisphaerota bacterium ZTH]|nr:aspartate kinase [Lentisphaerota bacterium]WET06261.1 aspartate kinase [Lentisphaerota bacterium ZTH]
MPGKHTVEKIGGTSMSRFGELMENILIAGRSGDELYNRLFVVSAYGGITNLLLENKKTGEPGIYGKFAQGSNDWEKKLEETRDEMIKYNRSFEKIGLDQKLADDFVNERIEGIRVCLRDLKRLRTFGHFNAKDYLPATREFLSAFGEAHSAFNSVEILKKHGVNATFVDLTGWKETESYSMEEAIERAIKDLDFSKCMPIVTGYVKCAEGIMNRFNRGYSEITFSKLAVISDAREGIIHKEFHLCTADPKLVGEENVRTIGNTNFDIADQLADMDMEAIHSKASKEMELQNIPIRVKNAFEPEHPGTLISRDYVAPEPRVDMICGRSDMLAIEVFDPEMVGTVGYDYRLLANLNKYNIDYIAKNTNANTITHYVSEKAKKIDECVEAIQKSFPGSKVTTRQVAIVAVIGSNMKIPGFLSRAANALAKAEINILALDQCMRQVNMQFVIDRREFESAQVALHGEFV